MSDVIRNPKQVNNMHACRLVEEITRYQFFLQVKLDILQGRLPVTHELAVDLAALALQCKFSTILF